MTGVSRKQSSVPEQPAFPIEATRLFQQSGQVMLTFDLAGRFTSLNPAAARQFARSATDLLGLPFETVLDVYSHAKARLMLERTLVEGSVSDWELDHLQPDGSPVLIGYTTSLLYDDTGELTGIAAVGRDLTRTLDLTARLAETNQQLEGALLQLEKMHRALKATQAQLVQSEKMRALGQLVAGVAHEINTPLSFIANNLSHLAGLTPNVQRLFETYAALKKYASNSEATAIGNAEAAAGLAYLWDDLHDLVAESQQGVERISHIVYSLRNFARLDEAEMKEADINEGLASTVRMVRPLYQGRAEIVEQYGELPLMLCYPGELNQVFLNLLSNALQAIEGVGHVWITSSYHARTIVITIRDSGMGMDDSTLARLGEPFFTTKPVGKGSGLGLAVSMGIIEHHHGQLLFSSAPGKGTTATVILPVRGA